MNIPHFLKRQTVTQAALLIAVISFISKFFGFFREVLVAKYFGATALTDAFLVALIIPGSILGLFAAGFSTLVIPFYLKKKSQNPESARQFVNSALTVWGTLFAGLSLLILLFTPALVRIVAYGFKGERFELAVTLTRFLIIVGLFNVLSGIFTGLFQAEKQFFFPIFTTFLGNVVLVASLFFLHHYLGLHSWTLGQILSSSIAFFPMFLVLYWRYKFFHNLSYRQLDWQEIQRFGLLLLPLVVSGGLSMLNQIVDKTIASGLDPGSIAALNFGQRVWGVPISLLATPIATAVFPYFSELALNGSARKDYEARLQKTLGISFYIMIPSSFLLFFLSEPVVRLLFERGAFNPQATALTAFIVRMYALGLFGHAVSPILSRVFYSFKNTLTPVLISALCVGLNIILNIILSRILGAGGIALATSVVMATNVLLFGYFLRKYLTAFSRPLIGEILKITFCSIPIGLSCLLARPLFLKAEAATLHGFADLLLKVGLVALPSLALFALLSHLLRLPSYLFFRDYTKSLFRKLGGK
ncbi:MAG: murein biosynthesis integral membrane protein MurJ [Thermodesulfobacteriota bacterium]